MKSKEEWVLFLFNYYRNKKLGLSTVALILIKFIIQFNLRLTKNRALI